MTLIEAALVLSLTGILLAAFVPTFLQRVRTSKIAEATEQLDALHRRIATYYGREHVIASTALRACLPESAGPYPLEPSATPVAVEFPKDEHGGATWRALGLVQPKQLRYSYEIEVADPGCGARKGRSLVTLRARGDLDGDGAQSLLERTSQVEPNGLVPQGPLRIVDRIE